MHAVSPAPADSSAGYVSKPRLAELVADFRRARRVSDELAQVLIKIAGGVWDRYHYTASKEDFVQDVLVHLLSGPLAKADPAKNVFAFLTTCSIRYGGKLRNREQTRRRKESALCDRIKSEAEARLWQPHSRRRMAAMEREEGGA